MREGRAGGQNPLLWAGAAALVVAAAASTAFLVVTLFDGSDRPDEQTPPPALARDVTLRAAPEADAEPLMRLHGGVPVALRGRSADGAWLLLRPLGQPEAWGWAPAASVLHAGDVAALPLAPRPAPPLAPTVAPISTATPPATSTATSSPGPASPTPADLPDLVVQAVLSRQNELVVVVTNRGAADVTGAVFVTVDGGPPRRIDVEGKPLRPGDTLEQVLAGEYVQRRASISVEVSLAEGVEELDAANNHLELVIEPDVDNDMEVRSVTLDTADRHLVVTLANNSIIPLVGSATVAVRRTDPQPALIGRMTAPLAVEAGGTQRYDFRDIVDPDLTRLHVILSTDAINDAHETNNVFPR